MTILRLIITYIGVVIEPHNIPETLFATELVIQSNETAENSMDLEADGNLLDKYRRASN